MLKMNRDEVFEVFYILFVFSSPYKRETWNHNEKTVKVSRKKIRRDFEIHSSFVSGKIFQKVRVVPVSVLSLQNYDTVNLIDRTC